MIDATGVLPDKTMFDGAVQLAAGLKKNTTSVSACVTQKMFAYSLGRNTVPPIDARPPQLISSFAGGNYNFRSLIIR